MLFRSKNQGFEKESFANSVKDAVSVIFGWDRKLLEGDTNFSREWRELPDPYWSAKFGKSFSPRYALQLMGTEAGRNVFDENLWVYSLEKRCKPSVNYVIADVRFTNEIDMIRKSGGKIVWVRRGNLPEWYSTALNQNSTPEDEQWVLEDKGELMEQKYPEVHISEWAWISAKYDAVICNDFTIERLEKTVDDLLYSFFNYGPEAIEVI